MIRCDIDLLLDQLLPILGPENVDNFLDQLRLGVRFRGSPRDRLKEWFLSREFRNEMVSPLTEYLGNKGALHLLETAIASDPAHGQAKETIRSLRPRESIERWLALHRIPALPSLEFPPRTLGWMLRNLAVRLLDPKDEVEWFKGLCVSIRSLLERSLKEVLGYSWGILIQKWDAGRTELKAHFQRRGSQFYWGWKPTFEPNMIAVEILDCSLTLSPLLKLLLKTVKMVSMDDAGLQVFRDFISPDWLIERNEIELFESIANIINPQLHDGKGGPESLREKVEKVAETLETWEARNVLPLIVVERNRMINHWGTHVNVTDVSGTSEPGSSRSPRELPLFYKDLEPPEYLGKPTYLYLANNPLPVRFETLPYPRSFTSNS